MVALSLVIPTFNENQSLPLLLTRIESALKDLASDYDIWFIDDSEDDTPLVLAALQQQNPAVHFFHRHDTRGLSSAVLEGFRRSEGKCLVVMDADLQHPPEILPAMLSALRQGTDIVIPSRFIPGGSDGGLNVFRKTVSLTARILGQCLVKRFRSISDCTSGYFGLHRQVIEGVSLQPCSWKILMEILVKGNYQTLQEIPYPFAARDAGKSKMNFVEQWKFLKHLLVLARHEKNNR